MLAPLVTAASLGVASLRLHDRLYSIGPVSPGHAGFAAECRQCHTDPLRILRAPDDKQAAMALNTACLRCHGNSIGHAPDGKTATHHERAPGDGRACARCHREHEGRPLLPTDDEACVECHRDLHAVASEVTVADRIAAFESAGSVAAQRALGSHPQFRRLTDKTPDPGTLRFNHRRHLLDAKLPGPDGKPALLQCHDCHRGAGDEDLPFRFGTASTGTAPPPARARSVGRAAFMAKVSYASHCAGCHHLDVPASQAEGRLRGDDAVARDAIPHTTPGAIRNYLRSQLSASPRPRADEGGDAAAIAEIEASLYRMEGAGCRRCHEVKDGRIEDASLPAIVPTAMPTRFFPRASFDHRKHAAAAFGKPVVAGASDCLVCHALAVESTRTADLLVPGIATCRRCHGAALDPAGWSSRGTAGVAARCTTCHTYHVPPPDALGPTPVDDGAGPRASLPSLVAAGLHETREGLRASSPLWRLSAFFELPARVWGHPEIKPGTDEFRREVFRRYGLHDAGFPNDGLPLGLLRTARTSDGEPGLTVTCEYCHSSSVFGRLIVGQPNPWANMERLWSDLAIVTGAAGADPIYYKNPLGNTVVNGADHLGLLGMVLRNPDLSGDVTAVLRWKAKLADGYKPVFDALAYIKTPPWYNYATRKSGASGLYWDGGQPKDGNFAAYTYMITFRDLDGEDVSQALAAWKKSGPAFLSSLSAPKYPFAIDRERAARGRGLYERQCARCHGSYPAGEPRVETLSYPGQVYPVDEVKTDPKRAHFPEFFVERTRVVLKEEYTVTNAYAAPPLTAIWARAPYLHNGSVPTLLELLDPPSRRPSYVLSADPDREEDFDQARVGWRVDPLPPGDSPDPLLRTFDPSKVPGLANTGHLYGAELSATQKSDVIEFLKEL